MALQQRFGLSLVALSCLTLAACDHNDDNDPAPVPPPDISYSYELTVQNITQGQPLSPVGVTLHADAVMWEVGMPASDSLELLAEGGDNSEFLATAGVLASASGAAPILPGNDESITVTVQNEADAYLSIATMLVNTNDAFVGITGYSLAALAVQDSVTMMLPVLDAGTEANSEMQGTIPGPADGGEGFNSERDDADVVSFHPGVVTEDDGLSISVLKSEHRFDNPAVKVTITRIE
ncbi:spondin domain-containing protein [Alteromonas lipolytica]|uniref:Spondin domain-containing protein n=1 Tax=Alteromonas lipolytica TaxID=1856405 RepID=A0A1E8FCX9_9ALTE|nr:spondin domain-containing protein [Alteromonas lipolytica]OFI33780.1 hypothetical protein BFC17_19610 [Alteromonas lipolytica]GGF68447.1 hypothetical protein GCM10011338_20800 [Alteromonas lipolytica]